MHIRDFQSWLQAYDEARGRDRITLAHTFMHLVEEIGEIAREVEYVEGYREPGELHEPGVHLAGELADAAIFLFKLAYQCGIDLEDALAANMLKVERRFSADFGQADTARYLDRQAEILAGLQREPDRAPVAGDQPGTAGDRYPTTRESQ